MSPVDTGTLTGGSGIGCEEAAVCPVHRVGAHVVRRLSLLVFLWCVGTGQDQWRFSVASAKDLLQLSLKRHPSVSLSLPARL